MCIIIHIILTYLRGLEIAELKESDMPMVYIYKHKNHKISKQRHAHKVKCYVRITT